MVFSITLDPYSIPKPLKFISSTNLKIATPPRSTELPMASAMRCAPPQSPGVSLLDMAATTLLASRRSHEEEVRLKQPRLALVFKSTISADHPRSSRRAGNKLILKI